MKYYSSLTLVFLLFLTLITTPSIRAQSALEWPEITEQNKPWTRWWWMGSSVDEANLTRSLELYRDAGLGGVEITPIYGVRGQEGQFIDYLSSTWMDRLVYTLEEAGRLGLGVDMATGTGWPFGGPHVEAEDASRYVAHKKYTLEGGAQLQEAIHFDQEIVLRTVLTRPDINQLKEPIRDNEDLQALALDQVRFAKPLPLQVLMAYSDAGDVRDLTDQVDAGGQLNWTAPAGNWTLYAVFVGWHGKMVERAAPGGEGYAINHFSREALDNYLAPFNEAFAGRDIGALRGFFNDSYEVDDANGEADWTPAFLEEFFYRRGYDLREHLPALFGDDSEDKNRRVLTDYRQTLSELLLDQFTEPWTSWAHEQGAITRNQAHGSPGSILDLYATTDIPETESTDMMRIKFASSAAHVTGKPLAAAEAATWLNEHFSSNWADVKEAVDRFLLGGVNHIVYHGTAYSPEDAPWPGWLFYAAVHFSPQNPMWQDFGALNNYVARAQSVLQAGRPDNDVLLYVPLSDRYAERDPSLLVHFHGLEPFEGMVIAEDADLLQEEGYAFDFISDMQLQATQGNGANILAGAASYQTVVVPAAHFMPLATMEKLVALAEGGATVIMHGSLPEDVPGLVQLATRQAAFQDLLGRLVFEDAASGVRQAAIGAGQVLLGDDLASLLEHANVHREAFVDDGLQYIRRLRDDGTDYFITNRGDVAVDGWVPINTDAASVAIFDPMTGNTGLAEVRTSAQMGTEVYLQLAQGESVILRGFESTVSGSAYTYWKPAGAPQPFNDTWQIRFMAGGPELPAAVQTSQLGSWTEISEAAASFAGTVAYTMTFDRPEGNPAGWLLELGEVHETARITLNGTALGTLIGPVYQMVIAGDQLQDSNVLQIEVSNGMANRIAAMDRAGETWKKFYNINVSARLRENLTDEGIFGAAHWETRDAGLLGPVMLTPLRLYTP